MYKSKLKVVQTMFYLLSPQNLFEKVEEALNRKID